VQQPGPAGERLVPVPTPMGRDVGTPPNATRCAWDERGCNGCRTGMRDTHTWPDEPIGAHLAHRFATQRKSSFDCCGADVDRYFREGRIREIAEYCESDVVNTYRSGYDMNCSMGS
jgi:Predicted 3'-5' exonuclease related to the exonuclease domain of PolB